MHPLDQDSLVITILPHLFYHCWALKHTHSLMLCVYVYIYIYICMCLYGTPLQYSCLENPMDRGAWSAAVHRVATTQTWLSDFTFTFHFHALEKEMATHSSVLALRIPGMGEPGGLPSMRSHRVGHDWSDLAADIHKYEGQTLGDGEGLGGMVCCSPWGRKESDLTDTEQYNSIYIHIHTHTYMLMCVCVYVYVYKHTFFSLNHEGKLLNIYTMAPCP